MIWPNLRTGSPTAIGAVAILWPLGMRSTAIGAPTGASPGRISSTATITLSCAMQAQGARRAHRIQNPRWRRQVENSSGRSAREGLELLGRLREMIGPSRRGRRLDVARSDRGEIAECSASVWRMRPGGVISIRRTRSRCARTPSRISPLRRRPRCVVSSLMEPDVQRVETRPVARLHRLALAREISLQSLARPRAAIVAPPRRRFRSSSARRMNIRSRTSSTEIRATNEPCCGSITTSRSKASRLTAAETGKRDTPSRSHSADLSIGFARLERARQDRLLELVVDLIGLAVDALSHGFYRLRRPAASARRLFPADMLDASRRDGAPSIDYGA